MTNPASGQPAYGTIDKSKSKKDIFLIDKNSGTYGTPAYGTGDTRGGTSEEVKHILNTPLVAKITLSSADILALNTTKKLLVAAPGVGYAIDPISACGKLVYNSATYAGASGYVDLIIDTGSVKHMRSDSQIIKSASTKFEKFHHQAGDIPEIIENKGLYAQSLNDFTVGDSTYVINVTYQIIEV